MSTLSEEIKKDEAEKVENIDYKMVTFSLAGKDYGIDIMKVKEISKANRFTHVPNASPYVRGVYNLRGDIISIIDLRIMFNIPAQRQENQQLENMIILRLEDYLIGVIVDSIDKVVGINSEDIQAPHPIFGDINIKFIKGVVENEGRLYLILDVERIFGNRDEEEQKQSRPALVRDEPEQAEEKMAAVEDGDADYSFIVETLYTFKSFAVSDYNRDWVKERYEEWKQQRSSSGEEVQLQSEEDADEFLKPFYSPDTGALWSDAYREKVKALFEEHLSPSGSLLVWNPGCGNGHETYSLAVVLRELYPDSSIKIWGHDSDLLGISTAPNLVLKKEEIPEGLLPYTSESKNGVFFNKEIRDIILFEYHNVFHTNPFPDVDLIVSRDLLSFQKRNEQEAFLKECSNKLKPGGLLLPGAHERAVTGDFEEIARASVRAYKNVQQ
ncbi:MAG: chemotaxis protein CheW [Spirochaetaceae bacterium]